jgi:flagellar biosynthesis protein FliR
MFDKMKKFVKTGFESVKRGAKKVKDNALALFAGIGASFGASAGNAAVTYDDATNKLVGAIDMGPFYSGVGIAFAVIGAVLAVGLAISIVKRGK